MRKSNFSGSVMRDMLAPCEAVVFSPVELHTVEDLPRQVEGDLVETTWPRLQELLEKHPEARAGAPGRARTLALFGVLCRLCWPQFVAAGICRLFYIVTGYAQPLGLYIILRRLGADDGVRLDGGRVAIRRPSIECDGGRAADVPPEKSRDALPRRHHGLDLR